MQQKLNYVKRTRNEFFVCEPRCWRRLSCIAFQVPLSFHQALCCALVNANFFLSCAPCLTAPHVLAPLCAEWYCRFFVSFREKSKPGKLGGSEPGNHFNEWLFCMSNVVTKPLWLTSHGLGRYFSCCCFLLDDIRCLSLAAHVMLLSFLARYKRNAPPQPFILRFSSLCVSS